MVLFTTNYILKQGLKVEIEIFWARTLYRLHRQLFQLFYVDLVPKPKVGCMTAWVHTKNWCIAHVALHHSKVLLISCYHHQFFGEDALSSRHVVASIFFPLIQKKTCFKIFPELKFRISKFFELGEWKIDREDDRWRPRRVYFSF